MTDTEFISRLLDINQPMTSETTIRVSCIASLLIGARKLSGCNIVTGKYEMLEINEENFTSGTYHSFQFTGLINYLIFLEQIGSIFKPKECPTSLKSNGISNALNYFSTLKDESKINGIVSLRNSLAHRFGLATEKNPKTKPARKFTLNFDRNKDIISNPTTEWNGDFSDKTDSTSTNVFIINLIELIEGVYLKIKEEHANGNLELILKDGMNELKARYTIIY
jgi:hypothetical protein